MANDFKVTPWEVSGNIDYKKLSRDFGTKLIDQKLLRRIEKHTGEVHPYLSRGYYYSHRDLDLILKDYESGKGFFLYT
ncbi:MAG: tryptophan--tRNA ligase, partial [Candidatus Diapherotrites archaeon]|nr:tryptophan--tRNA ligase [Candidatus Diapherotrites archaeon]